MRNENFKASIDRIKAASPLELPYVLMEIEMYEQKTAQELLDRISSDFQKEELVDNVVTPVLTTVVDSLLAHPRFKGVAAKSGLSAQRVMQECKNFNYDGKIVNLMPDARIEYLNQTNSQEMWKQVNRSEYVRSLYANPTEMNRYKQQKIKENGSKKNLRDEYLNKNNITARKDNPDNRRNDPKNEYTAETDHVVPLKTIFNQLQSNAGLSDGDIKRIANQDENFALTGRRVNNPKRDMSNREFIALQDKNKKEGKPYVEISQEARANMIKMEKDAQRAINKGVNNTVLKNLTGRGVADREERKAAMEQKKKELGRNLTSEERKSVDKSLATKKAMLIHKSNAAQAGKQSLMYAIGSAILFIIKPLYYEIKDCIINGFKEGVYAETFKEAIRIRSTRIKDYAWNQLKSLKELMGSAMDMLKNFFSALLEGLIDMFVGVFKKIFKVLKEGVKVFVQAWPVLFGEQSKTMTAAQKGDAILKLIGGSVVALCGIGIEMLLEKAQFIPEDFRGIVSTLLSGLASILVFYALDKADLFNVKAERRQQRIKEVFDERIKDIREATASLEDAVAETLKKQTTELMDIMHQMTNAIGTDDYETANKALVRQAKLLNIQLGYETPEEFHSICNHLNWDL